MLTQLLVLGSIVLVFVRLYCLGAGGEHHTATAELEDR
jgi:hypothetical protein